MRSLRVLFIMAVALALAACGSDKKNNDMQTPPPGTSTFLASGGTSSLGSGGWGGSLYIESYGSVKVLRSGTLDASFGASASTPTSIPTSSFGSNPWIVSGGTTTVQVDADDPALGNLCTVTGDPNIYIGDGDGVCDNLTDTQVTGLTIDAGATLVLVDQGYCGGPSCGGYAVLQLSNDLVINGTLTVDVNSTYGIYVESNLINVGTNGRITASATMDGSSAGSIYLGYGNNMTKSIINHGMIEAKGLGTGNGGNLYLDADDLIDNYGTLDSSGGSSAAGPGGNASGIDIYLTSSNTGTFNNSGALLAKGGDSSDSNSGGYGGYGGRIYIDVNDIVVNAGTIDASGGNSDADAGGSSGELDVFVGYGDFHSSGTVRMNGGKGATNGGEANWSGYSAYVETAYYDNTRGSNGDIIISGTWEANGGDGGNGNGGNGGYIYLQTDALGAITLNATISIKGGNGTGIGSSGGNANGIDIYSYVDYNGGGGYNDPTTPGDIRIAGQYDIRGGNGDQNGGSGGYLEIYNAYNTNAAGVASNVELVGFPSMIMNGGDGAENGGGGSSWAYEIYTYSNGNPTPPIRNEANVEAKGGASSLGTGGTGGYVDLWTDNYVVDANTTITNTGSIDVSGGSGDTGGSGSVISLSAQHVTNSGKLISRGGNVTTGSTFGAGSGGAILLNSSDSATPTTYSLSDLSVAGGTPDGSAGTTAVDGGAII